MKEHIVNDYLKIYCDEVENFLDDFPDRSFISEVIYIEVNDLEFSTYSDYDFESDEDLKGIAGLTIVETYHNLCTQLDNWYKKNYRFTELPPLLAFKLLKTLKSFKDPLAEEVFYKEVKRGLKIGSKKIKVFLERNGFLLGLENSPISNDFVFNTPLEELEKIWKGSDVNELIPFRNTCLPYKEVKSILSIEELTEKDTIMISSNIEIANHEENYFCVKNNHVYYIDLSSSRLAELPISLRIFKHLEWLILNKNNLKNFPLWFGKFKSLKNLDLKGNSEFWPDYLPYNKKIKYSISSPSTSFPMIKLKAEEIVNYYESKQKNLIEKVSVNGVDFDIISGTLDLSNVGIKKIEDICDLFKLKNLKNLILNSYKTTPSKYRMFNKGIRKELNEIKEFKELNKIKTLEILEIKGNCIEEIYPLDNLKNLRKLNLSNNKISEIKNLEPLINLTELNLNFNQIKTIKGLDLLKNLITLKLTNNKIKRIEGLENLQYLQNIQLKDNDIKELNDLLENSPSDRVKANILVDYCKVKKKLKVSDLNIEAYKRYKKLYYHNLGKKIFSNSSSDLI